MKNTTTITIGKNIITVPVDWQGTDLCTNGVQRATDLVLQGGSDADMSADTLNCRLMTLIGDAYRYGRNAAHQWTEGERECIDGLIGNFAATTTLAIALKTGENVPYALLWFVEDWHGYLSEAHNVAVMTEVFAVTTTHLPASGKRMFTDHECEMFKLLYAFKELGTALVSAHNAQKINA